MGAKIIARGATVVVVLVVLLLLLVVVVVVVLVVVVVVGTGCGVDNKLAKTGTKYANVFPDPVFDIATTSRSDVAGENMVVHTCCWIRVGRTVCGSVLLLLGCSDG